MSFDGQYITPDGRVLNLNQAIAESNRANTPVSRIYLQRDGSYITAEQGIKNSWRAMPSPSQSAAITSSVHAKVLERKAGEIAAAQAKIASDHQALIQQWRAEKTASSAPTSPPVRLYRAPDGTYKPAQQIARDNWQANTPRSTSPTARTALPSATPSGRSTSGSTAWNAAAKAGGTAAVAASATRLATSPVVKNGMRAIPTVGSLVAGGFAVYNNRNADSLLEFGGAVGGAVVGSAFGQSAGSSLGLATGNPLAAAAGPSVGAIGGGYAGEALGRRIGRATSSALGRIPGVGGSLVRAAAGTFLGGAPLLVGGAGLLKGLLQPETVAGDPIPDSTLGPAPFSGGQGAVLYNVTYSYDRYGLGNGSFLEAGAIRTNGALGPISSIFPVGPGKTGTGQDTNRTNRIYILRSDGSEGTLTTGGCAGGCFANASIISIARADGQPDTFGDPPAAPAPSKPRPYNPIEALPPSAAPGDTPPAAAPAPNNNASQTPPARPKSPPKDAPIAPPAPAATLPPGDPLAPPAQQQAPDPTAPPRANPKKIPNPTPTPDRPTSLQPGQSATLSGGTRVTATEDGYTVDMPADSPSTVRLPNGEVIGGGQSGTVTEEETGNLPWWVLPALGIGAATGIGTALKLRNAAKPGEFTQAPPQPPSTPPPAPPDTGCKCNAPIVNRLDKLDEKLTKALGGVSAAGDAGILTYLQKMQAFAEKAWEMSRIQKVLNAMTLITVLHNASMVSRDVGETLGYALAQGLDVIGVRDEEGNALDVNNWFGTQANNFFENLFGAERWHGLNETWNKANRIISSATMIVWTLRSIHDGTQEVLEWTAENTGKIGNALKKWGVVGERAYPWMAERVKAQDAYRRKFSRVLDGLESVENTASSYAMVTSEIVNIQDEIGQLGEQRENFTNAVRDMVPESYPDNSQFLAPNEEAGENARSGPAVAATDMEPGANDTP